MSLSYKLITAIQKQAGDSLHLSRIKLLDEFKGDNPKLTAFWYKGNMFGDTSGKSIVLTHNHPMFDKVKSWDDSVSEFTKHKAIMQRAVVRLITKDNLRGYVPSYLELALKQTELTAQNFIDETAVQQWEHRNKEAVNLMRFYSMNHVFM